MTKRSSQDIKSQVSDIYNIYFFLKAILEGLILKEGVKLDKEATNIGGHSLHGRLVDEGVCGILVYTNREKPGRINLSQFILSLSTLDIMTGPDETG